MFIYIRFRGNQKKEQDVLVPGYCNESRANTSFRNRSTFKTNVKTTAQYSCDDYYEPLTCNCRATKIIKNDMINSLSFCYYILVIMYFRFRFIVFSATFSNVMYFMFLNIVYCF